MDGRRFVALFAVLSLVIGVALFLGIARTSSGKGSPVASLDALREHNVILLEDERIFLVYNDGEPLALTTDAQHVGDEVEFCPSSQLFESPAHGEKFDIRGYYYAGPASSGLDRYPIRVEGDAVYVDTENPIPGPARGRGPALEPQGPFCVSG